MQISPPSAALLTALDVLSGKRLTRRDDLGVLLEVAYRERREGELEELSFFGKFVVRAFGIMKRIGRDTDGYDRLASEFSETLERVRGLLALLLQHAPGDARGRMTADYLAMTPGSLDALLALLQDVSWFKNWRIDHPGVPVWEIKLTQPHDGDR